MKLFKIIFVFLFVAALFKSSYSQIPSYTIQVKNPVSSNDNKKLTFEIYFTNTSGNVIEFAGAQYFFKLPLLFGTLGIGTGVNSGYQQDSSGGTHVSDFPQSFIPRNPSVAIALINGVQFYELRLAANSLAGMGGLLIPPNIPKLVLRMKLISSNQFDLSYLNLMFRDSCNDNPVSATRTRVNFYIGTSNTEVTRCANHFVDLYIAPPLAYCSIRLAIQGLYDPVSGKLSKSDTIALYLRKSISPYQIIDSSEAVVDSNSLTADFILTRTFTPKSYYLIIKHKNSLETWSRADGDTLFPGNNFYDFTTSGSQAYGSNMVFKGNKYCIFSGNVNNDMIIDSDDLIQVDNDLFNFISGNVITDLNGDSIVDIDDLSIADANANNFVLVEWPGLTPEMRRGFLKNKFISVR